MGERERGGGDRQGGKARYSIRFRDSDSTFLLISYLGDGGEVALVDGYPEGRASLTTGLAISLLRQKLHRERLGERGGEYMCTQRMSGWWPRDAGETETGAERERAIKRHMSTGGGGVSVFPSPPAY